VTTVFYSTSTILRFLALWRLRVTEPDADRPFRIPGGHVAMALVCVPPIALSLFASSQCGVIELITALSLLACVVLATLAHAAHRRMHDRRSGPAHRHGPYASLEVAPADAAKTALGVTYLEICSDSPCGWVDSAAGALPRTASPCSLASTSGSSSPRRGVEMTRMELPRGGSAAGALRESLLQSEEPPPPLAAAAQGRDDGLPLLGGPARSSSAALHGGRSDIV